MKGFFYVSLLLGILKEIAGNTIIHKTDSDEKVTVLFDLVQEVFQKMLECIACIFRKQPEESLPVLCLNGLGYLIGGGGGVGRWVLVGRVDGYSQGDWVRCV